MRDKIPKPLAKRKKSSHKGDYGRVLIVAGSPGMSGAAVLASRGALRSGAGYAILAVPKELLNSLDPLTPEVITVPFEKISENLKKADAAAAGPGMGVNNRTLKIIRYLASSPGPLVLDADGINVLAKNPNLLKSARAKIVITPHPGEMARLFNKKIDEIQNNRLAIAGEAARRFKCVVVLKGDQTAVADPSGEYYINKTGNPGMATAGAGDVLTGMLAGFMAQGLAPFEAAKTAVYLHGLAGDLAARQIGEYGMIASDIAERIPYAIQKHT